MAKNRKNPTSIPEKEKDYYKLNTEAVDRLVNADKKDYSLSRCECRESGQGSQFCEPA
jgi:hypothetical protein